MPEREQLQDAVPNETGAVRIIPVRGTASLWLKSWLPKPAAETEPVVLAGTELPSQVGATLSGPMRVLCVGPGEWLIVSREHTASALREHLQPDLPNHGLALVDLTDGLTGLEVRGLAAHEVLSNGCGLDLHPRNFPPGRCARTRFAQIAVVIDCLDATPRFELHVASSYLQYLHSWLTDATVEFEGPVA